MEAFWKQGPVSPFLIQTAKLRASIRVRPIATQAPGCAENAPVTYNRPLSQKHSTPKNEKSYNLGETRGTVNKCYLLYYLNI
jgi:hypothetical protein